LLVPSLAFAAVALAPARADACSGVPWPTYTITALSPSPGSSGVARDAGIIVAGTPSAQTGAVVSFADVELIDTETDETVPLAAIGWFAPRGTDLTMALHPAEPLEPLRAYRAEARLRDGFGNSARAPVVSNFLTSDALLEPLVLSGELGLSLRGAEMDVIDREPCGSSGPVIGKRRALFADVLLPAPSGGQGVYSAFLDFSDNTPLRSSLDPADNAGPDAEYHEIRDLQGVHIEPGQALTVEQEVFEEDFAYAGCFNFTVTDPAGHLVQTSRCLPRLSPDDVRALSHLEAPLPIAADEEVATQEVQRAAADYREEGAPVFGCSLSASVTARAPTWPTLLLASLLAALRYRAPDRQRRR
jgi:hypothetical protein